MHEMGVATSLWACTPFCHSLNKSLGWIIHLTLRIVTWSFGCCLRYIFLIVLVDEKVYLLSLFLLCYFFMSYVPRMLEFTKETLPKFTRILINCSIYEFSSNLQVYRYLGRYKNSKCHVCVESKQTRKPHMAAEARNLTPLELIYFNLCKMNGVLTKGGKNYFMTLIDDCTIHLFVEVKRWSFALF